MNHFKLTEFTHPAEIFKYQENLRAEREWATNFKPTPIPKVESPKVPKFSVGVYNFIRSFLP